MRYFILMGTVVAALFGYYLVWNRLADRVLAETRSWIAERRAAGLQVEHGTLHVDGFPFRLQLTIPNPAFADPRSPSQWRWQGTGLTAYTQPWTINHVILQAQGDQLITWRDRNLPRHLTVRGSSLRASLVFTISGEIDHGDADLQDVELGTDVGPVKAARLQGHARRSTGAPAAPPVAGSSPSPMPGLDVALSTDGLVLAPALNGPLGLNISKAELAGTISGPVRPGPIEQALANWRDDGGDIDLNALHLAWGPLDLKGNGTLALDKEMRPLGAMTAEVRGYNETLDALGQALQLRPGDIRTIKVVLAALASQGSDGKTYLTLPITAQDGSLFLGPARLMRLLPVIPTDTIPASPSP